MLDQHRVRALLLMNERALYQGAENVPEWDGEYWEPCVQTRIALAADKGTTIVWCDGSTGIAPLGLHGNGPCAFVILVRVPYQKALVPVVVAGISTDDDEDIVAAMGLAERAMGPDAEAVFNCNLMDDDINPDSTEEVSTAVF